MRLGVIVFAVAMFTAVLTIGLLRAGEAARVEEAEEAEKEASIAAQEEAAESLRPGVPLPGGWVEVVPPASSGAVCARGGPFSFFWRPAPPEAGPDAPLVVEFEGGGACWSTASCQRSSSTFKDNADSSRSMFQQGLALRGIRSPTRSPARLAHHVYIPYCTGDIGWGNASAVAYAEDLVIHHVGALNIGAALAHVRAELPTDPPRILATGCSAGSYASFLWSLRLPDYFPTSRVVQLGDAGCGQVSEEFLADGFSRWSAASSFPPALRSLVEPAAGEAVSSLSHIYAVASATYPTVHLGQMTTAYDWNQVFFFLTTTADKVSQRINRPTPAQKRSFYDRLVSEAQTMLSPAGVSLLVLPGDDHCHVPYDRLFRFPTAVATIDRLLFGEPGNASFIEECVGPAECEVLADMREAV